MRWSIARHGDAQTMNVSNWLKRGNVSRVVLVGLALASLGVPVHSAAEVEEIAIITAVRSADTHAVRTLISHGIDVNTAQPDGATALHWAAYRDDVEVAELLLHHGADVNVTNELGASPLWLAADNGSPSMVALLLEAGATADIPLPEGETPIMSASRSGNVTAVRLLLEHGVDVNVAETTRGQTALMWAVAQAHHQVIDALIRYGANVEARSTRRSRLMHAAATNASQYDQGVTWHRGGFTPLLFAARHGDVESARLLLAAGANINLPAPTGASPLVIAAHSGHGAFGRYLLDAGADPNSDDAGYTALHAAILRGDERLVETLLQHGADPNSRLLAGTPLRRASQDWSLNPALTSATPYWLAAYYREPAIMRDLVAAGADPRMTTLELWRPVFERAGGVGPPHVGGGVVPALVAAVRGPANKGRFFNTLLREPHVEEQQALATVRVALEFGADVDAPDLRGGTALHTAAQRNFTTIVRLLAEQGADLNVVNDAGRTPLQLASAAEASRARSPEAAARAPGGNTAEVLREFGALETTESTDGNERVQQ